jgi:hypothetical protein
MVFFLLLGGFGGFAGSYVGVSTYQQKNLHKISEYGTMLEATALCNHTFPYISKGIAIGFVSGLVLDIVVFKKGKHPIPLAYKYIKNKFF